MTEYAISISMSARNVLHDLYNGFAALNFQPLLPLLLIGGVVLLAIRLLKPPKS